MTAVVDGIIAAFALLGLLTFAAMIIWWWME